MLKNQNIRNVDTSTGQYSPVGYNNTLPAAEAPREPQVRYCCDGIDTLLNELREAVERINAKTHMVQRQEPEKDSESLDTPPPHNVPLCDVLISFARRINSIKENLNKITNRIEL